MGVLDRIIRAHAEARNRAIPARYVVLGEREWLALISELGLSLPTDGVRWRVADGAPTRVHGLEVVRVDAPSLFHIGH